MNTAKGASVAWEHFVSDSFCDCVLWKVVLLKEERNSLNVLISSEKNPFSVLTLVEMEEITLRLHCVPTFCVRK